MTRSLQRGATPVARVVQLSLIVAAALSARPGPVLAQVTQIAKASTSDNITAPLPGVTTTRGTGATAAFGIAGGNSRGVGATRDPAAGGAPFDDTVPYGNTTALTRVQTQILGQRLINAYPDMPNTGSLAVGESIRYSVSGPSDKVGPALGPLGFAQIESTALATAATVAVSAFSEGTIKSLPNATNKMAVDVTGGATASILYGNPFNPTVPAFGPAFAVGIVKDPITYALTSPGTTSTIFDTLGDSTNPFSLQASIPGSSAAVFYDFGTDQTGLLVSFTIGIDSQTTSKDQAAFTVDYLNPILGFASMTSFENYFLSYLAFDSSDQSLSASTGIPLFQVGLSDANPSATLWYTEGAVVGVAAPAPGSVTLMGIGLIGLAAMRVTIRSLLSAQLASIRPADGEAATQEFSIGAGRGKA
jgi:hypothetical protein